MDRRNHHERGLSLVEVTIMLMVLMLLTGVLAPSMFDFINDAKWVKVKEDCEAIGLSVARITRDVGPCLKFAGNQPCTKANRVDLLHSDGPAVVAASLASTAAPLANPAHLATSPINWNTSTRGAAIEDQFVSNSPVYASPTGASVGPLFGLGWRGAYLSPPIGPDPWGHQYLVNSAFLAVATDAPVGGATADRAAAGDGSVSPSVAYCPIPPPPSPPWAYNTFCLSAGPNGLYETAIGGNPNGGVTRVGDDFVFVIGGNTR
jgi:type II secretory pathway pseudopilin PulG